MKRIPVRIPLSNDGSISDVINDFINKMQEVTGGDVNVECDLQGHITIYYEVEPSGKKLWDDPKVFYRGQIKTNNNDNNNNKLKVNGKWTR